MRTNFAISIFFFVFSLQAQDIEKFSIDSGGSSASAGGINLLYTLGEVTVQEQQAGSIILSEGFIGADLGSTLDNLIIRAQTNELLVYPNPANHVLKISTPFEVHSMELYDQLGKLILEKKSSDVLFIDQLDAGVYFLKIRASDEDFIRRVILY